MEVFGDLGVKLLITGLHAQIMEYSAAGVLHKGNKYFLGYEAKRMQEWVSGFRLQVSELGCEDRKCPGWRATLVACPW